VACDSLNLRARHNLFRGSCSFTNWERKALRIGE
jgi:hypothetical protein